MKQKNSKKYKQILSVLLSLFTVFTLFSALTTQLPTAEAGTYGKFEYEIQDGEVTITDYPETASGAVTIPSKIKGYPVTCIGYMAFFGCKGLTSVKIPDSVTYIDQEAFSGCTGLKSITIGDGVTYIGYNAFYGCTGLTSITIGDSVTDIGGSAFYDTAYYNKSSNWKNGVLYIGKYLIRAKESISGSYTIKSGTKCIADCAFFGCSGLKSITIPNSVTSIGGYVFSGCSGLKSITIPNSVTNIDGHAFEYCTGLKSITIPNSVTSIGGWAFCDCTGLNSIIMPNSITSLGNNVFYNTAYYNNSSNWKNGVLYIGKYLINVSDDIAGSYTIKSGTKCIADYAFCDCTGLFSITIPDSVTSIGEYAFDDCSSNLIIYGYSGSYAEGYAKENNIKFIVIEKPDLSKGDPDGDGDITAADARFALRLSVGLENYKKSSAEYTSSDIDGDGSVTAADARLILRGAVGLENTSKWGK